MARPKNTSFPCQPNMDDCKMIVESNGVVCYIMDTCCKHFTPEDKARVDQQIVEIAVQSALRRQRAGLA